ncbi:MAG: hypothetical protein AB1736_15235 [Chloroflexota bacterium]
MTAQLPGPGPAPDSGLHETHDRELIAARAAGDLLGTELARADSLRATCAACRALHDDLVAIATATRSLPAPVRPAALEFTISPERAAALQRGAAWRRLLRPFGPSGSGTVRPLATALTTLGVAGLLLAALPGLRLGAGAALAPIGAPAAASEAPRDAMGQTAAPEIVAPGDLASPGPSGGDTAGGESTIDTTGGYGPAAPSAGVEQGAPTAAPNAAGGKDSAGPDPTGDDRRTLAFAGEADGRGPLVILSLAFLGAGLGLFLVRRVALRLR